MCVNIESFFLLFPPVSFNGLFLRKKTDSKIYDHCTTLQRATRPNSSTTNLFVKNVNFVCNCRMTSLHHGFSGSGFPEFKKLCMGASINYIDKQWREGDYPNDNHTRYRQYNCQRKWKFGGSKILKILSTLITGCFTTKCIL